LGLPLASRGCGSNGSEPEVHRPDNLAIPHFNQAVIDFNASTTNVDENARRLFRVDVRRYFETELAVSAISKVSPQLDRHSAVARGFARRKSRPC
jgi:hypothetical protein